MHIQDIIGVSIWLGVAMILAYPTCLFAFNLDDNPKGTGSYGFGIVFGMIIALTWPLWSLGLVFFACSFRLWTHSWPHIYKVPDLDIRHPKDREIK